jgi:thioredoxin 1
MNTTAKISIIIVLLASATGIMVLKNSTGANSNKEPGPAATETAKPNPETANPNPAPLPRLVDIGAGKCIPCKMMAPILEELKKENQGKLEVLFLDVTKLPGVGDQYGIQLIPTQIFYDATGKELFRHEGFFSKEDILSKWKEFGVQL